jgi:hypothetical protein
MLQMHIHFVLRPLPLLILGEHCSFLYLICLLSPSVTSPRASSSVVVGELQLPRTPTMEVTCGRVRRAAKAASSPYGGGELCWPQSPAGSQAPTA